MGGWYRVVKTIKGHQYLYDQQTYREGRHVRTRNRYIGAAKGDRGDRAGSLPSAVQSNSGQLPVTTTPAATSHRSSWGWFGSLGKSLLKQFDAKSWVIDTAVQLGLAHKKNRRAKKQGAAHKHGVTISKTLSVSYKVSIMYRRSESVILNANMTMMRTTQTIVVNEYRYIEQRG